MPRSTLILAVSAALIVAGGVLATILQAAGMLDHYHPCDDPSCGRYDDDHGARP